MSRFKSKKGRAKPKINTSALPDIIFMLLFFFMVVTVLRNNKELVKVQLCEASEIEKLEHHSLINHVYIGPAVKKELGTAPIVQINDSYVGKASLDQAIKKMVATKPDHLRPQLTTSLKVDQNVTMGLVTDVKTALRKAEQYKVSYTALAKAQ